MSNGQPIVSASRSKPIPTLMKALPSVNLHEQTDAPATIVRSDVCVVPAAGDRRRGDGAPCAGRAGAWRNMAATRSKRRIENLRRGERSGSGTLRTRRGRMKQHIALVGFMAAGKSTIGKRLSRKLKCAFFDTDELVVEAARPDLGYLLQRRRSARFAATSTTRSRTC